MALNPNQIGQPQEKRQGSGFTNLQRIMQANQGNRLGSTVGQGIQQAGEQTRQGLGQAQEQFKQQSEAGRLDTQQNKERVENVLKDPTQATGEDINQFARFRAGQYGGPQTLTNIQNLQGQAQEAQNLGQAASSQAGRQGLLQRFAAAPGQYGSGQQRLDTLLLGTTGAQPLREARRSVSGLGQQVAGAGEAAQNVAQQYQNLARGFGQDVTQRTGAMETEAQTAAEQRAAEANKADEALRQQVEQERQAAQTNQLSQQALEQLGLSAGQRTYGANLGQYLGYQGRDTLAAARPEEVLNQQEFQKFSNLKKLMGQDVSQYDPTKVGTYQAGQETFDKTAAQGAIGQAQQAYQQESNDVLASAKQFNPNLGSAQDIRNQLAMAQRNANAPGFFKYLYQSQIAALQPLVSRLDDIENRYSGSVGLTPPPTQG